MNYKPYPAEFWPLIEKTVEKLKEQNDRLIAVFDADGTLWDTDLGENFFQYQIDHELVTLPPRPFEHYLALKEVDNDPRNAFMWLAQINSGKSLAEVKAWCEQAFNSVQPNPIFNEQKKLVRFLREQGVDVFVVTASIKWAVEPGGRAIGIDPENVLGVSTRIMNGVISDQPILPITYRKGKVETLLERTQNRPPFLASGNSMGDYELLHAATHIRLAVSAASRDDRLFKTESELLAQASANGWLTHRFV